jgi:hypothetical protein
LDQQAEADRHRILSGLENKTTPTTSGGEKSRKGVLAWVVAGAAVLALGAGAGLWLVNEGEKEIVLAGTAPLPTTPAPVSMASTEPPVVRGTADEVSSAAILEHAPVVASKSDAAGSKKQPDDELTKMLDQSTLPVVAPGAAEAAKGSPADQAKTAAAGPARAAKPTRSAKAMVKKSQAREEASNVAPRPRVATAPAKKKAEAKPAAPVDNDVALLAALVAHSKATQQKSTGAAAKLRQCKSLSSAAEAKQCRARVCAGAKGEPECKSSSLSKSSSEG